MMKIKLVLAALCMFLIEASGQISRLMVYEFANLAGKKQPVDLYMNIGFGIKSYISPRLNVYGMLSYRNFEVRTEEYIYGTDFLTYFLDQSGKPFYTRSSENLLKLKYATLTAGVEFKLSPIVRVRYNLENNFLFSGKVKVGREDHYIQYGKKAFSPYMLTHNAAALIRISDNGVGFLVSATFYPGFLRNDINYTYSFMNTLRDTYKNSYIISLGIWVEAPWTKRKRSIL